MPNLRRYNVFITHAWEYHSDYYRLETMLRSASNFDFYNYSVPRHDPLVPRTIRSLGSALETQMRPSQVVLVIAGMYASYREWIDFEISYALRTGKPIIGIAPWGSLRIPAAVKSAANVMVNWNTNSIVTEIRKLA